MQTQIQQAVETTKKMLQISKNHQQDVMNEIVKEMGMSFHILEMSFEQEEYLTNLVHNALTKHSQDDVNFIEVSQLLDSALESVDELKVLNNQDDEVEQGAKDDFEDELF